MLAGSYHRKRRDDAQPDADYGDSATVFQLRRELHAGELAGDRHPDAHLVRRTWSSGMTSVAVEHYRLLVIEDEVDIRRAVGAALKNQHPAIIEASTGHAGVEAVDTSHPDLIILDLGLPDLDGLAVCERIRAMTACPIIVLTARHGESDTVALLNAGADDYITKPFSTQELAARVSAQLRRSRTPRPAHEVILADGLVIDLHLRQASRDNTVIRLTPIEWALLS